MRSHHTDKHDNRDGRHEPRALHEPRHLVLVDSDQTNEAESDTG